MEGDVVVIAGLALLIALLGIGNGCVARPSTDIG
jgi:hypothetical protein